MLSVAILGLILLTTAFFAWQQYQRLQQCQAILANYKARYSPLIDAQAELDKAKASIEDIKNSQRALEQDVQQKRTSLEKEVSEGLARRAALAKEISSLEEHVEDLSFGFYN